MRIWQISDLHLTAEELEQGKVFGKIPDADVAVVAGDLGKDPISNIEWCAKVIRPHMPVVYVSGNHDFRGKDIHLALHEGRKKARETGIAFLDRNAVVIGGTRFMGGTLWSDFKMNMFGDDVDEGSNIARNMDAVRGRPDFTRSTIGGSARFLPEHAAEIHEETKKYIDRALAFEHCGPTVVVTHHAPITWAKQPGYTDAPSQPSYVSDLEGLIKRHEPDIWIFGHLHSFIEEKSGRTRLYCNPRGYAHEDTGWRWDFVVEI